MMFLLACGAPPETAKPAESAPVKDTADPGDTATTVTDTADCIDTSGADTGATDTGATDLGPDITPANATTLPVPTAAGLPELVGFSVNADIHPHGLPTTWQVEYGETESYGAITETRALPGRLDAWYREDWDQAVNGYAGGIGGAQLSHQANGGPDGSGFVRYTDDGTSGNDTNHYDGIGIIHLGLYGYIGHFDAGTAPPLHLGGGFPDLRGARLSMQLRGNDWRARGSELGSWIQAYRDISVVGLVPEDSRYPNWAYTGEPLTALAQTGAWELAEWTLHNRTTAWTFAGANGGRLLYDYGELDGQLSHVNVNFFPIQILNVDLYESPSGSLDYDQFTINYRQHSVVAPSNGGTLVASPGGTGLELLTDGWRNGAGKEWQSDPNPAGPVTFEYAFADPITVRAVTVHNALTYPSETFTVSVSSDAGATWTRIGFSKLPNTDAAGPNFLYAHLNDYRVIDGIAVWVPLHADPVDRLQITVNSGYQAEAWGLGEIEVYGAGAIEATDDAPYAVNQDVLVASGTWHYRVIAESAAGRTVGPDQVVVVP
jgi:hypothetical protein